MELNELKPFLRDYVESITTRSKGGLYVCPLCGSGTGAHKTGAFSITPDGLRWKCFGCNEGGDIFDLVARHENMTASEAAGAVRRRYSGEPVQQQPFTAKALTKAQARPDELSHSFKDEIERYAAALEGSEGQSYLEGRGFTLETMKRFKLGYNARRRTVTIPYNPEGGYYGQRSVIPDSERKHDNLKGVHMPLYNSGALYSTEVVFVVESPLCAISIEQEGGAAVAISGTNGGGRLIEQLKKKPTTAAVILCMDNDEAGQKATEAIGAELEALNVFCVDGTSAIMGEVDNPEESGYRKDPNEVLQRSGAAELRQAIKETVDGLLHERAMIAQEEAEAFRIQTGAATVDSFLQDVQSRKYEPMPTGITDIDRAIGGGFIRQQLVLLGAAPGAGKTALAQWIFEGMAKRGTRCIYLNLEMSREQVLARSLARMAAEKKGHRIGAVDILQGYKWTEERRTQIMEVAEEYKTSIAPNMVYNPDGITSNLDSIMTYIEADAAREEAAGNKAPVVVLDYLQIISGDPHEDSATLIKRAVMALKGFAMKHNTIVFVIMAHNRAANSTGDISMESGRDTSALEYSADLQLGLTYTKCLKRDGVKGKSPDELTKEELPYVTMRVLKGRFGGRLSYADFYFDGVTGTFTQLYQERSEEPDLNKSRGRIVL